MNLVLLFADDFVSEGRVRLHGRRHRHILSVHRIVQGGTLRVGLANGKIGRGTVTLVGEESVEMDVVLDRQPPPVLPVTLVLAYPRPKALRRIVKAVTAMGVKLIYFVRTWRVEKSYLRSPFLREEALREQMILGLEQGCDTVFPKVELRELFVPFMRDEVPGLLDGAVGLAADPGAACPCPHAVRGNVCMAIGPDGGFVEAELDTLRRCGFELVSLGDRILPVEDAIPFVMGRLC